MTRYVVEVNEAMVLATRRGVDWWTIFLLAHRGTNRITEVTATIGGALCHVECDSRAHATALAATMVERGLPHRAVKARTLRGPDRRPQASRPQPDDVGSIDRGSQPDPRQVSAAAPDPDRCPDGGTDLTVA